MRARMRPALPALTASGLMMAKVLSVVISSPFYPLSIPEPDADEEDRRRVELGEDEAELRADRMFRGRVQLEAPADLQPGVGVIRAAHDCQTAAGEWLEVRLARVEVIEHVARHVHA